MANLIDFRAKGTQNPSLWHKDARGRYVMPVLQSEFLDWLLTLDQEKEHKTVKAWADAHGITSTTCTSWKRDRRFLREWEERAASKNISVDRLQNVINTLYEAACKGDVNAAKLYMQHVEKLRPPVQVEADTDVADLSDEELHEELRGLLEEVNDVS